MRTECLSRDYNYDRVDTLVFPFKAIATAFLLVNISFRVVGSGSESVERFMLSKLPAHVLWCEFNIFTEKICTFC